MRARSMAVKFMIASAKLSALSLATAPAGMGASILRNSPTALLFDATTGVPLASASSADKQNVSSGPGARATSAQAKMAATFLGLAI